MEKLVINDGHEYLHEAIGISNERAEELGELIGELVDNAVEKGLIEHKELDGEPGYSLHGNLLLDILMNEIAQTEQERLLLMMRFMDTLDRIREADDPNASVMKACKRM